MYHYKTYLKHCIGDPIQEVYYNKQMKKGVLIEDIIKIPLTKSYFYREHYMNWCDYMEYVPFKKYSFKKYGDRIYNIHHHNYDESSLDNLDRNYLKSIERQEVTRKSYINQNMILFYKNYFKRRYVKNIPK